MLYDNIFTKAGTALLRVICRQPYREFYPAELAENSGISITHILRLLTEMKRLGIISAKTRGKRSIYKINIENFLAEKLFDIFNLERRLELPVSFRAPVEEFSKKMENETSSIVLFGSVAKGLQKKGSDVDLFIISKNENKTKIHASQLLERLLGFYTPLIEEHIFSEKNFDSMYKKGNDLVINLIKDGIILYDNGFYLQYLKRGVPEPSKELISDILEFAKENLKTAEKIISINHEDAIQPLRNVARDCCRAILLMNEIIPGSKHELPEQAKKINPEYSILLNQINSVYYKYAEKSEKIERKTVALYLEKTEKLLTKTLELFAGA